jgi:hypothetical protein
MRPRLFHVALLGAGGLVMVVGVALLIWGVRQQVAWADCARGVHCIEPASWPVTVGVFTFVGGGFTMVWTLAARYASRALDPPEPDDDEPQASG